MHDTTNTAGRRYIFFLPFLILCFAALSLFAITPATVPGNLKDINATSKAWLSSQNIPITFYSKDTNLSLAFNASIKMLSNTQEIAILLTLNKHIKSNFDTNNSFTFLAKFSDNNITTLQKYPIFNIGIKTKHTVSHTKKEDFLENNESILQENSTIYKNNSFKYAYKSIFDTKAPIQQNENKTLNIGMKNNQIYIVKSIDANQTILNVAFKTIFYDNNTTITYQTKWIKIEFFQNDSGISSQENFSSYDIKNGKNIFIQNCAACHRYNYNTTAPAKIAPILTNIGGWANKEYIVNSLLHPQKYESPKYKKLIKEGKIMPMPSFDWLDKKDLNDLVNFLQNLKAKDTSKS